MSKKICMLIIFILCMLTGFYVFAGQMYESSIILGDADKNNIVNKKDAELILAKIVEEKDGKVSDIKIPEITDTNSDNKVDLVDVLNIMRYIKAKDGTVNKPEWINQLERKVEFGIVEDEIKIDLSNSTSKGVTVKGKNYGNVTYNIENTNIATVDTTGMIKGHKNGETYLTIKEDKCNISIRCKVTVKTTTTSIKLSKTDIYLDLAHTSETLTATQYPNNVSSPGITWSSSNTNVVKVDNGKITRVGTGTADITAQATDGSGRSAKCKVVVKQEKLIICGPSTVSGLANARQVNTNGDKWGKDYCTEFGFTVKQHPTDARVIARADYEEINIKYTTNIKYTKENSEADLFFINASGMGLRYFAGSKFDTTDLYSASKECFKTDNNYDGEGGKLLGNLLDEGDANHWRFTVAFVCSGNDLTKSDMNPNQVDDIAQLNADYCSYLASTYTNHNFYVFPITPMTDAISDKDKVHIEAYNGIHDALDDYPKSYLNYFEKTDSNNTKRYRFAWTLNKAVNNKPQANLKYANGFFLDLLENSTYKGTVGGRNCTGEKIYTKLNGQHSTKNAYQTYDGRHYTNWGCRIVMEQILVRCGIVDSSGKKLK